MGGSEDRLAALMDKALPLRDALALKILRNLAAHGGCTVAPSFMPYMDELASILQVCVCASSM